MKPTDKELKYLIKYFQDYRSPLAGPIDGIWGPKTQEELRVRYPELRPDRLQAVWDSALRDVGKGGDPGTNNVSPYIRTLRAYCGFPVDATGPWCAIFPSKHLLKNGIDVKSRGAYRLCETLANTEGFKEYEPEDMEVGKVYLCCWKRLRFQTHREAHVRLVKPHMTTEGKVWYEYVAGNERPDNVVHQHLRDETFKKGLIIVVGEA